MATARVMSWNIKTLGDAKVNNGPMNAPAPTELIKFIRIAIQKSQAHIVGISEVRSNYGDLIGNWLCAALNGGRPNGATYQWSFVASAQQDGGTMEQYIVLWKDEPNVLSLDQTAIPGPSWLMGVVDDHSLGTFFNSVGWTTVAQKNQAYAALAAAKYIYQGTFKSKGKMRRTISWRVVPDQWQTLSNTPEVHFSAKAPPPTALTQAQRQDLGARLVAIDMLRFVGFGDRSPFVVNFALGAAQTKFTYAFAHSPGSTDPTRFPVTNVAPLNATLVAASATTALLFAGDFNVAVQDMSKEARQYRRITLPDGTFTFGEDTKSPKVKVFAPVTGPPLNAKDLLPRELTSISQRYIADNSPMVTALANAYDKMFFHSGVPAVTATLPRVINVMKWLDKSQQSDAVFSPTAAASAMQFLRDYKGLTPFTEDYKKRTAEYKKALREAEELENEHSKLEDKIRKEKAPANSPLYTDLLSLSAAMFTAQDKAQIAKDQLDPIGVVGALVLNQANTACTGVGTALAVYRRVISDHLPVIVTVTGP